MKYTIIIAIIALLVLSGCAAQSIIDIKNEEHIGKTVRVQGTVEGSIKIGQLSAYTLIDSNGDRIGVSTQTLPEKGEIVTAKGTLLKDTIFGYYIKVD